MRLDWIVRLLEAGPEAVRGMAGDLEIKGLAYDSRHVKPGFLFVALPGQHKDGAHFIDDALARGAVAVIGEPAVALRHVPYVQVPHARRALADMACAFFENPSASLDTFGVTGTNGKTTTAFMIREILEKAGSRPGLISTVRYEIGSRIIPANRTTPEAPDLQAMLQKMERAGCRSVVMEVSSHALDQERVRGIDFDVALFTNLSRDHLDYHKTMEQYFAAKTRLFDALGGGTKKAVAVLNADDEWALRLQRDMRGRPDRVLTYGLHPAADVRAETISLCADGSHALVRSPWGTVELRLALLGRFNIHNALAALTACAARGTPIDAAADSLAQLQGVPGRLQKISHAGAFQVFVDYAHTDDALNNVLEILSEITSGRLVVVFGCGGDRDRSKRAAMGAAAERWAAHTYVTSDNPRTEDPAAIAVEVAKGFTSTSHYTICLDRANAIEQALRQAKPGDTVLIAGKGHENYQEFGHTIIPFDDAQVAWRLLQRSDTEQTGNE